MPSKPKDKSRLFAFLHYNKIIKGLQKKIDELENKNHDLSIQLKKVSEANKNKPRFGWRYCIIRKSRKGHDGKTEHYFDIHEIYNLKANKAKPSWTLEPVTPNGSETLDDLRWSLSMMLADSFRMPVYEIVNDKLVEVKK